MKVLRCTRETDGKRAFDSNQKCLKKLEGRDLLMFREMFDGFENYDDLRYWAKKVYRSQLNYFSKKYLGETLDGYRDEDDYNN